MKREPARARIRIRAQDPVLRARIAERLEDLGDLLVEPGDGAGPAAGGAARAEVRVEPAPADAAADVSITPREAEVLALMAEGLANKEIGARLAISAHTAKFHVESLLKKLDAANRAEAVREGIRRGLIGL